MSSRNVALSRRELLQLSAAGALGLPASGWFDQLAAHAAATGAKPKSCILLFMFGGPSHIDTFDPKPENPTSEINPIATSVPGIQISEFLPKIAGRMKDLAILRGMSTSEGSHGRARYTMHTGYREGVGGVVHPSLGAITSRCLGRPEDELPNYFALGGRDFGGGAFGAGYAGPMHAPVEITDPTRGVENLKPADGALPAFDKRAALLDELERGFIDRVQSPMAAAHRATYQRAARLMHSSKAKAFDISLEPESVRDAYGRTPFGDGCLTARRLVEHGVSFVEVILGNWDTHRENTAGVRNLSNTLDPAMAALLDDLRDRGMLDSTLVIWMGEFGRTPHVGKQGGRDHYPQAWSTVLAGGGIKAGQVIGRTDSKGGAVEEGRVGAVDFMATVCQVMGIDYREELVTPTGRPIRIVDKNEKIVKELF
jgi:hypothetical protein